MALLGKSRVGNIGKKVIRYIKRQIQSYFGHSLMVGCNTVWFCLVKTTKYTFSSENYLNGGFIK